MRSGSSGVGLGVFAGEEGGWPDFDLGAVGLVGNGPSRSSSMDLEPTGGAGSGSGEAMHIWPTMQEAEPSLPVPYLGGGGVVVGMESPTETLDPVPEVDTPAEGMAQSHLLPVRVADQEADGRWLGQEAEEDGDDLFRKMVSDFQRAGFEI